MIFRKKVPAEPGQDRRFAKRIERAEALRRHALSPWRISLMILALPVTTASIAVGVYLRTSEYDRNGALIHLAAFAGCDVAAALGVGGFHEGYPGYHSRNDPDGDGVACEIAEAAPAAVSAVSEAEPQSAESPARKTVGNAKFVRP